MPLGKHTQLRGEEDFPQKDGITRNPKEGRNTFKCCTSDIIIGAVMLPLSELSTKPLELFGTTTCLAFTFGWKSFSNTYASNNHFTLYTHKDL